MIDMDKVFCQRDLDLNRDDKVIVSISIPELSKDNESEYHCHYHIFGLKREERGRVIGVDSLQSLQLVMKRVGAILYTSPEWTDGRLSWNGDKDLGFPLPDSLKDLQPI